MGSFGEKLRKEREKRGVRLEQIAEATKISTRALRALEEENFSQLPGGIFNKGFVRSYARFLGIDEEAAVSDYVAAAGEQGPSSDQVAQQSMMARANRLAAEQAALRPEHEFRGLRLIIFLLIIVALIYGGIRLYKAGVLKALGQPQRQMQEPPQAATNTEAPAPQPVTTEEPQVQSTEGVAPAATNELLQAALQTTTVESSTEPVVLSIRTTDPCWMSITTDGNPAIETTMTTNARRTFSAHRKIHLFLGHPVSAQLSLNGKSIPIPGDLSHPRKLVVDSLGIQDE